MTRRKKRRRRKDDHVSHERWLVSYADFITLMFAFFVVLYSSAQIDKRKAGQLAVAIQVAFQQMGIFDDASTKVALASADPTPIADVQIIENVKRLQSLGRLPLPAPAGSVDRSKMDE